MARHRKLAIVVEKGTAEFEFIELSLHHLLIVSSASRLRYPHNIHEINREILAITESHDTATIEVLDITVAT